MPALEMGGSLSSISRQVLCHADFCPAAWLFPVFKHQKLLTCPWSAAAERARNDLPIGCRALQFLLDPFLFCSPHVLGATRWVQGCICCMKLDDMSQLSRGVLPSLTIFHMFSIFEEADSRTVPILSRSPTFSRLNVPYHTFIAAASPTWSWSSHLSSSGHQLLSNWLPEGCSAGRRCCV